jgi:hypothetical protein
MIAIQTKGQVNDMGASGRDTQKGAASKQARPFTWREQGQSEVVCRWQDIDTKLIATAVALITTAGAAIILGITSDGGAYSLCVLDGTQKIKEYPHGSEACTILLQSLIEHYT